MGNIISYFTTPTRPRRICIIGLDGSGKTTMMTKLVPKGATTTDPSPNQPMSGPFPPIMSFYDDDYSGILFESWDVMGHGRENWWLRLLTQGGGDQRPNYDAIIWVVDGLDEDRLPQVKNKINDLLAEEGIPRSIPILFLVNKQDMTGAWGTAQVVNELGLDEVFENVITITPSEIPPQTTPIKSSTATSRPMYIINGSIEIMDTGIVLGLLWVAAQLDIDPFFPPQ